MDIKVIEDSEMLYRVVRVSYPDSFIDGRPTAALFMDAGGASVDRDGGRDEKTIVESLKQRFQRRADYKTAVKLTAGECRRACTYPNPIHNQRNRFHAEIHDSENTVEIGLLKAIQLAAISRVVSKYE